MDEILLVRLGRALDQTIDWLVWNQAKARPVASGQLSGAAELPLLTERATANPCYVLVPQEQVLACEVKLPNSSRAALEAIPFQLEDQLCSDLDQLHFAVGKSLGDNRFPVSVVDRQLIEAWRERLVTASIPVKGLFADAQTLQPEISTQPIAVVSDDRVLVKGPDLPGLALQRDALESWRNLLEKDQPLEVIDLQDDDGSLVAIAQRFSLDLAVNLLQGDYKLKDPVRDLLVNWKKPAILLALVGVLSVAHLGVENWRLNAEKQALDQQVTELYRSAFPDAKRIVNPRLQMERALEQLHQGQAGAPLLRVLDTALPAFTQNAAVSLTGLRFDGVSGSLVLELEAATYQSLQQFNAVLTAQGLASQLGQFSSAGGKTRGQVTIEGVR